MGLVIKFLLLYLCVLNIWALSPPNNMAPVHLEFTIYLVFLNPYVTPCATSSPPRGETKPAWFSGLLKRTTKNNVRFCVRDFNRTFNWWNNWNDFFFPEHSFFDKSLKKENLREWFLARHDYCSLNRIVLPRLGRSMIEQFAWESRVVNPDLLQNFAKICFTFDLGFSIDFLA